MISVLLVDDEKIFLSSLRRLLVNEPIELFLVESGDLALELLEERNIDLVITDYKMPGMDGLTLIKRIRQKYPHIIPVMLTALYDLNIAVQAINDLGIYKFLLKPVDPLALVEMLHNVVAYLDAHQDEALSYEKDLKVRDAILNAFEDDDSGISIAEF